MISKLTFDLSEAFALFYLELMYKIMYYFLTPNDFLIMEFELLSSII